MGYTVYKLQDVSPWAGEPDIVIDENDPGWKQAYANWLNGKNPTDSKLWKKGIVAVTKLKEKQK